MRICHLHSEDVYSWEKRPLGDAVFILEPPYWRYVTLELRLSICSCERWNIYIVTLNHTLQDQYFKLYWPESFKPGLASIFGAER